MVPGLLRKLFVVHFIVDYIIAFPLMIAPVNIMIFLGWDYPDIVATRLVAAALIGIGGISLIAYKADADTYRHMLTMKLLWSGAAIFALGISMFEGAPPFTMFFLIVFVIFFLIWLYYRIKLK